MMRDEIRAIEADCARLIAVYFNLADAGRWEELARLFTEDGRLARPTAPDIWIEGRPAILEGFLSRPARKARHICSNIVVDVIAPDEAKTECAIALFMEGGNIAIGSYHDRLALTEDGWRFAERRGSLAF